ncbi:MAG: GNAT family N-acetyltransferase [Anaerolineae bacterium]|nr:GNAT family N-acetyltransferase [Anaerolineae bacterium]
MPKIEIMPCTPQEAASLYSMNHAYFTDFTWQMDRKIEPLAVGTRFHQVRLPRQMIVEPPLTAEERLTQNLQADTALVASHDQETVGYVVLQKMHNAKAVRVIDFVVRQKMRRKGIGTALLLAAQDWSLHEGCQRILVEVQSKNYPAIQLVTRLGYEYCGFHEYHFANHDIVVFFSTYLK